MKNHGRTLLFILLLLGVAAIYNYHEIVFFRPQSIHKWRQTDCASLALNYYKNGMRFFQPETHNLTSDGGTSGKVCPSEVPVLYFTVAGLYKVFGYHEWMFRALNTLLFFIGLLYLFKLNLYLLRDTFWAIALALLLFTSPVLVFYGNNFLSNSSALAFAFKGWYFFMRFYREQSPKWFNLSMVLFFLAGAFKVSAMFSFLAIGAIYLLEAAGIVHLKKGERLFDRPWRRLWAMVSVFVPVVSWLLYARFYNKVHDTTYFSTTIFPVWSLDTDTIRRVTHKVLHYWSAHYFHVSVFVLMGLCAVFLLVYFRKNLKFLNLIMLLILGEVVFYVLLQFWTFADHDYYTIDIYIFPALLFLSVFFVLKERFGRIFYSPFTKVVFLVFLMLNVYHARKINHHRYSGMNDYAALEDVYSLAGYLDEIGVTEMDTVISIPDGSHASLYLMGRKGWTEYTDARFNRADPIRYNQDSAGIQRSIDRGARYLIVRGIDQFYLKPYLRCYCTDLVGRYNSIFVFDLKSGESNFGFNQREIMASYSCGAEVVTPEGNEYLGEEDSTVFKNGQTRSGDASYRGSFSAKLDAGSPYGMTIACNDLEYGESFEVTVWRKSPRNAGGVVVASAGDYYNKTFKVIDHGEDGWEKLLMEFFVDKGLENKDLVVYLYNPGEDPVYFDDFKIVRYKSVFN